MRFEKFLSTAICPAKPYERTPESFAGILRTSYPHWRGWGLIDAAKGPDALTACLTSDTMRELVAGHYRRDYNELCCEAIQHEGIAMELFEAAGAIGRTLAIRLMQQTINLMADNDKYFPIEENGAMSDQMVDRLNKYHAPNRLHVAYMALLGSRYSSNKDFFRQWILS